MRMTVFALLAVCAAAPVDAADLGGAAREISGAIDGLSMQLFLQEAETAYANGDFAEAHTMFSRLAERGNTQARYALGTMYEEGQGVLHDYEAAFEWYRKAAEQGFAPAQLRLARMYYFGRHVRPDNVMAYVWASIAASQGDETALRNREKIARLINDHQLESARELAAEWIAKYNRP